MKKIIILLTAAFLLQSCKKEKPVPRETICYQCQIIALGVYIANLDTCFAGKVPPAYFGAEFRCRETH